MSQDRLKYDTTYTITLVDGDSSSSSEVVDIVTPSSSTLYTTAYNHLRTLDKLDLHFIKNYAENIYGVYKQTHIDPSLFLFLEIFSSKSCFNDLQKSLLNKKVVIICLLFNSFDKYTNN
ncbi:hypothetical protein RI543_004777 [Arxiozyma heterogenica]|uniref:Uncharacterized protein n=1 Tax=Arxiozyma heterogenica TaxID=278026 RepID=A0AAN7VZ64_9SACH|nr:hypothetical protein RI543_004777 [Kazachstania heterogenica]